ncbi:efflux RND transporter periplasmic adaptor subunit [Pyxidicoccus parkwayensis]|uniref:Efflux RND transporter periplasmic adaptor subunit n=1 Tax=Pyxidicoccus parkwayensis TaxID=2813578 RepID=A0ABX7P564_9BACT|nr:efflux RND transporter periplasmic adaptor subunit [Pyxidicoccus parkwaysis]QSQ25560.1 efflux RND transporter periplasmic adaptor subunit [Pyxidicoccus parkwaysis]
MSKTKKWVITGAAALLLGAGGYAIKTRGAQPQAQEQSTSVAEVQRQDMEVVAEAAGLVEPLRVVEVKSKASGEVLRVLFDTGDKVEKDALLAEVDPRDVQNALAQAQADVESARVKLNTTEAQRVRLEELRKSGYVTQQEYESAVDASATARATKVRAETNLQLAKERSRDVTIRAPIAGTLLERTAQPGNIIASATSNVSGGTTLFKMADLSVMQVRAKVDETDVGQIKPGQKARVTMEAYPGRVFMGDVVKVEPQALVEQNVTLFPVIIRMDNAEGLLRPGMNAEVTVEISRRRDAVTVPNAAVASMKDARSAAAAVGVSEEAVRAVMRPPGGGAGAAGGATTTSATGGAAGVTGAAAGANTGAAGAMVGAGNAAAGAGGAQGPNAVPASGQGGWAGGRGGRGARDGRQATGDTRPGIVFVQGAKGTEPRRVVLGMSDWENSEVVSGLEPGEKVLLISVAQLKAQQQKSTERMRQMTGGMIPGAGGGAGPRGGGGAR